METARAENVASAVAAAAVAAVAAAAAARRKEEWELCRREMLAGPGTVLGALEVDEEGTAAIGALGWDASGNEGSLRAFLSCAHAPHLHPRRWRPPANTNGTYFNSGTVEEGGGSSGSDGGNAAAGGGNGGTESARRRRRLNAKTYRGSASYVAASSSLCSGRTGGAASGAAVPSISDSGACNPDGLWVGLAKMLNVPTATLGVAAPPMQAPGHVRTSLRRASCSNPTPVAIPTPFLSPTATGIGCGLAQAGFREQPASEAAVTELRRREPDQHHAPNVKTFKPWRAGALPTPPATPSPGLALQPNDPQNVTKHAAALVPLSRPMSPSCPMTASHPSMASCPLSGTASFTSPVVVPLFLRDSSGRYVLSVLPGGGAARPGACNPSDPSQLAVVGAARRQPATRGQLLEDIRMSLTTLGGLGKPQEIPPRIVT